MFSPSLQMNFYDPMANLEMPLYNSYILSLFLLICSSLVTMLVSSNPLDSESTVDMQLLFAESSVFASSCSILIALCCPSMTMLYTQNPDMQIGYSLPVTAYQWYWSMSWEASQTELYKSRLESVQGTMNPFLLETSDCSVVPMSINTTFYITSNDVLHAFSLPTTFSKCDAVPSRLNAMSVNFSHPSVYYSQCSELCSVGHSYMPIKVEAVMPYFAR